MHKVFEGELAVKLHAKDVEVWTKISNKTKSPWGGLTVLDLLTNNALVLLGLRGDCCVSGV